MGLLHVTQPDISVDTRKIRAILSGTIKRMEMDCENVRIIVERQGKAEVATELGDDAAALQTLYNSLQTMVNDYGGSVLDLPT